MQNGIIASNLPRQFFIARAHTPCCTLEIGSWHWQLPCLALLNAKSLHCYHRNDHSH
jgi:hypothetical protein